jgi:NAD+ synthase (glutamine-hydrolysing)
VADLKLAIAQTNPVVGDFSGNLAQIEQAMRSASGADLLVFGELALTGYPLADLSYRGDIIAKAEIALQQLIALSADAELSGTTYVVGHVSTATETRPDQRSYAAAHNTATVFRDGKEILRYHKRWLPNYDVFDDWRNFVPGDSDGVFEVNGVRCAVLICEDIWQGNAEALKSNGAELLVVPNGSPYTRGKAAARRVAARKFSAGLPLLYVNLVGGQDELVFDGGSFYLDATGAEVFRAGPEAGSLFVEAGAALAEPEFDLAELWRVIGLGLHDYLAKTGQRQVVLGLSGGIDSAVCAAIAADAIGPENVLGVALPSRFSSEHSVADAKALASNLGIQYREIPIEQAHHAFEQMVALEGLAGENVQARIRAVTLMAISNAEGQLLLSTGNKSEIAVGYSTIYGDAAGGFAPIKDVFKTDVWRLARWRNESAGREVIPWSSIEKAPSAELRPDQTDQDSLPDYETLDAILGELIENTATVPSLIAAGHDAELVVRVDTMVRAAEWKRSQGAIGPKTTEVAFGRGRRVPLATRFGDLR